jgi:hypothetical protein
MDLCDVLEIIAVRSTPFDAYRVYDKIEGFYRRTDFLHFRGNPTLCREVYEILERLANERKIYRISTQRVSQFLADVPAGEYAANPTQRKALRAELGRIRGQK